MGRYHHKPNDALGIYTGIERSSRISHRHSGYDILCLYDIKEKYNVNLWRDYDEKIIILFCNNACSNSCYWKKKCIDNGVVQQLYLRYN